MKQYLLLALIASLLLSIPATAQLVQEGSFEKSKFRSQFLKNRTGYQNKTTACAADTIYYGRFNASSHGYVQIQPTNGQRGVGQFFKVDDSLKLYGMNFYAYSSTQTQTVTCKVFYANAAKRPAGSALATKTYSLSTGFNNISFMRRTVLFDNPVDIAANFVITIEAAANAPNIVFGSNSWADSNGLGNNYANLKFSTGWSNSLNIGTPPVPFDADFYFEPIVKYNMTAQFDHGPNSCMGNGLPFEFVNTSTFATNPQFSFEVLDNTLGDNFYWDYGDGSLDTIFHGNHFYAQDTDYVVKLNGQFEQWIGGVCGDSTSELVESLDLNASFIYSAADKLVSFTDKSNDAVSYEWDFGDNSNTSGQKDPKHLYNTYGTFNVKLVITNKGCKDSTTLVVNVVDYTGIDEERNLRSIELIPNPAKDYLQVNRDHNNNHVQWSLFSTQGSIIETGVIQGVSETIDVSSLENGVYFIQFNENGSLHTKRFVKL